MIRINLLNSKIPTDGGEEAFVKAVETSGASESNREIAIKLLLIVIFTAGIYVYEMNNIDSLTAKYRSLSQTLNASNSELQELRQEAGQVERLKLEVDKLEEKLTLLQGLSKKRLRELKTLDYLQVMIPDGVWLTQVQYRDSGVTFEGGALNEAELDSFVSGLSKRNMFNDVIILRQVESGGGMDTFQAFNISAALGEI